MVKKLLYLLEKKLIIDSFILNYIYIMNIQNPFIIGNKLLLPTESESLEINMHNVFNHFKILHIDFIIIVIT
jgi:hypothetical protein